MKPGFKPMRRLFWWQLSVLLLLAGVPLLAGMTAGAQVPTSSQNAQPAGSPPGAGATPTGAGEAPTAPEATKPQVTVTAPLSEAPLPALPPDEDVKCLEQKGFNADLRLASLCDQQLNWERHTVIEACINRGGNTALPRVIQACTELLDRNIFERSQSYFLLADRASAYFAEGDKQRALEDYDEAVKLAPHNAELYYDRGVLYAAQSADDAALRDFDKAIDIDPKLVPALRQRAKIHQARGDFSSARADYSQAVGLQPKAAALWSERGYVCLRQHDYESAMRDEAQAIQLDPKLARAYFLRGAAAAFGGLGDRAKAVGDIHTAVHLDPSLDRYVATKGKTAFLALPPL